MTRYDASGPLPAYDPRRTFWRFWWRRCINLYFRCHYVVASGRTVRFRPVQPAKCVLCLESGHSHIAETVMWRLLLGIRDGQERCARKASSMMLRGRYTALAEGEALTQSIKR